MLSAPSATPSITTSSGFAPRPGTKNWRSSSRLANTEPPIMTRTARAAGPSLTASRDASSARHARNPRMRYSSTWPALDRSAASSPPAGSGAAGTDEFRRTTIIQVATASQLQRTMASDRVEHHGLVLKLTLKERSHVLHSQFEPHALRNY